MKSTLIFSLTFLFVLPPSFARVPRVSTEAVVGCENCDHGTNLPLIEVKNGPKGQFPLPKCRGVRSDRFGDGKYLARRKHGKHTGVDWNSPMGTSVKSPWAGRVTVSGWLSKAAGYSIKVEHDNGYKTVYMHLGKSLKVKKGARVKAGQVIGSSSNTGNAKGTNPHLHFEVFDPRGRRVNPTSIFGCK